MKSYKAFFTFTFLFAAAILALSQKQNKASEPKADQAASNSAPDIHEMLLTDGGLLAFDIPKGWVRTDGPGLASFVPKGSDARTSAAMIYISGAPIGPDQTDKTLSDYVQSDIAGFKARFEGAIVHQEQAILLPASQINVPVYTFRSGEEHNAMEQVAYIQDTAQRVLTVVLSAKTNEAFSESVTVFQAFVKSFRGSIVLTPNDANEQHVKP